MKFCAHFFRIKFDVSRNWRPVLCFAVIIATCITYSAQLLKNEGSAQSQLVDYIVRQKLKSLGINSATQGFKNFMKPIEVISNRRLINGLPTV